MNSKLTKNVKTVVDNRFVKIQAQRTTSDMSVDKSPVVNAGLKDVFSIFKQFILVGGDLA